MAPNDHLLGADAIRERAPLIAARDRENLTSLREIQRNVDETPDLVPADRLAPLVASSERIKAMMADRLTTLVDEAATMTSNLRHLDDARPEDRPEVLRAQATMFETMAGAAELLALAMTVTGEIARRVPAEGT